MRLLSFRERLCRFRLIDHSNAVEARKDSLFELLQSYDARIFRLKTMLLDSFPDLKNFDVVVLFSRIIDLIVVVEVETDRGL